MDSVSGKWGLVTPAHLALAAMIVAGIFNRLAVLFRFAPRQMQGAV